MTATHLRRAMLVAAMAGLQALGGCITIPEEGGPLTNHVLRTVDDKSCMTASRWGSLAITGDINRSECKAIVEGLKLRAAKKALDEALQEASTAAGKTQGGVAK